MKKLLLFLFFNFLIFNTIHAAYNKITPGENWLDTDGNFINAHGGCVVYENGYYYLFGENRTVFYSNGVSCYKSTDLYNWKKLPLAYAIQGMQSVDLQDAAPGRLFERPKVMYNKSTHKYVMYVHWEDGESYSYARVGVFYSDKIEGPYTFYKTFRPNGHDSRDQTTFLDDDGRAYHFGSTNMNQDLNVALLNDDYLNPSTTETLILNGRTMEAPAIVKVGDRYFGIFSDCTGWTPNAARSAMTNNLLGVWNELTNPALDDGKSTTYASQSNYILKVEGKENAYIYMGDRWNSSDPGSSKYVWLPLDFRSGYPFIYNYSSWDTSLFDNMYRFKRAKTIVAGNTYALLARISNRLFSHNGSNYIASVDDDAKNFQFKFESTSVQYVYKLKDVKSGNYLEGGIYLALNPENTNSSQLWIFSQQSDNYYYITNRAISKCLTVEGSNTANEAIITLQNRTFSMNQLFGVYFDSKSFSYEEDDFFNKTPPAVSSIESVEQNIPGVVILPSINNGDFQITLKSKAGDDPAFLKLFNLNGIIVYETIIGANQSSTTVQLANLIAKGMYIVTATSNDFSESQKFVVK